MNILTLFNGIGGLPLACDRAGINFNNCYYSEIDKYANKVMEKHYPDAVALGDVTKWREWDIDWSSIDLVGAGFPCQAWSVAGQQLGDKDERGMLFWTTLEIIKHVLYFNPKAKFLMENVKMKKDFEEYITHHTTQALGYVEKTLINSALVSAQNRNRYYWTNFEVTQPDDKAVLLKDILEDGLEAQGGAIRGRYNSNGSTSQKLECNGKEKTNSLTTVQKDNVVIFRDKSKTVRASGRGSFDRHEWDSVSNCHYRKLTPIECERLQTLPDNWTDCISNTQRYKSIGNGWTIDVIAHILKCMEVNKLKDCA